jgi:hypothetical protein
MYQPATVFQVETAADFILGNKIVEIGMYDIRTQSYGTMVIDNF